MKNLVMTVVGAVFVSGAAWGETYSWRHIKTPVSSNPPAAPDWHSFGDGANWAVGEPYYTGTNSVATVPGAADSIYFGRVNDYTRKIVCFDLDGKSYAVRDLRGGTSQWIPYLMLLKNGTLTFSGAFTNNSTHVHVYDGGKFIHGEDCVSLWGSSSVHTLMQAHEGAEIDVGGSIVYNRAIIVADPGGTVTFSPVKFGNAHALTSDRGASAIRNYGTLNLPNGFTFAAEWSNPQGGTCYFTFEQMDGTLNVGGDFVKTEKSDGLAYNIRVNFLLAGGTVNVTEDSSFTRFKEITMTNDAVATVNVAAGKTFDLTKMIFSSGTKLIKTGEGTVKFGDSVPDVLEIAAGVVEPTCAVKFGTLSFSEGGTLHIAVTGVSAEKVIGTERAAITATEEVLLSERPVFRVYDGTGMSVLAGKITAPEGFVTVANGGTLTIEKAHDPAEFVWKSRRTVAYKPFYDPDSWGVGKTIESENPDGWIPGENDGIYAGTTAGSAEYNRYMSFDMCGGARRVKELSGGLDDTTWGFCYIKVKNGELGFLSSFTNRRAMVIVESGGRFVLGDGCGTLMGQGGAQNGYTVKDGGECEIAGDVRMHIMHANVEAGGKLTFRPSAFAYDSSVGPGNPQSYIRNCGTLEFPEGLTLGGASRGGCTFTVTQGAGEMVFGGDIEMAGAVDYLDFNLTGGTVRVTADAAFTGCRSVLMTNDVSAEISVDAGMTADFSVMTFNEGTSLVKSGEGALRLGASVPDAITVASGGLVIGGAADFGNGLSFAEGAELRFAAAGASAETIEGAENAEFAVDAALLHSGTSLLESTDSELLELLSERLSPMVAEMSDSRWGLEVVSVDGEDGVFRLKVVSRCGLKLIVR